MHSIHSIHSLPIFAMTTTMRKRWNKADEQQQQQQQDQDTAKVGRNRKQQQQQQQQVQRQMVLQLQSPPEEDNADNNNDHRNRNSNTMRSSTSTSTMLMMRQKRRQRRHHSHSSSIIPLLFLFYFFLMMITIVMVIAAISVSAAAANGTADAAVVDSNYVGLTVQDILQSANNNITTIETLASTTTTSSSSTSTSTSTSVTSTGITVGVYYYPWHGNDFHRRDGYLRKELQPSPQYPLLGEYDDTRPEVIEQHLLWSQRANIQVWMCSWWGPSSREDATLQTVIFPHLTLQQSQHQDHKIALLYEGSGRGLKASAGWDTSNVYPDMVYICSNYFDRANYYRIQNKPVLTIYLTRQLHDRGILNTVVRLMRTAAMDHCQSELYIIGDHVWKAPPSSSSSSSTTTTMQQYYAPFDTPGASLDAVTNYDVYGNVGSTPYATRAKIDQHWVIRQRQWQQFAKAKGVAYIPGTSPGYNDRAVRLQNDNEGLSRKLNSPLDEAGTLFAAHLVHARHLTSSDSDHLLLVNSFNEWHEDSQIEPVQEQGTGGGGQEHCSTPCNTPTLYTSGLDYECYGIKYLDILRQATCTPPSSFQCPPLKAERYYRGVLLRNKKEGDPLPLPRPPPPQVTTTAVLYYPYEENRSWFRNKLHTRQHIVSGNYSAITSSVVTQHLQYSREANIQAWIVDWRGKGSIQDQLLREQILSRLVVGDDDEDDDLQQQHQNHLQIAVLYQVRERVLKQHQQQWDYSQVRTDLEHLFATIITTHDHYMRLDNGQPVLFLSLTRWFHTKQQLSTLVQLVREVAAEQQVEPPPYIVGDHVWQSAPLLLTSPSDDDKAGFALLDAVVNIDVYGNMLDILQTASNDDTITTTEQRLQTFYQRQRDWRDAAWKSGCGYIPSVMPGFNNRAYVTTTTTPTTGIADGSIIVSRQLNETTAPPGSFFRESLQQARYLVDSTLSGLLVVASFNHFREDTAIEPVVGKSTSLPLSLTANTTYVGYGSLYLEILRDQTRPHNDTEDNDEDGPSSDQLFVPLQCNSDLALSSCTTKWTEVFGNDAIHNDLVSIPCGHCIVLDDDDASLFGGSSNSELQLLGGLDVVGMLYIRDVTSLTVTTPYIRIQGEFHVDVAANPVNGIPNLEFSFIDSARLGSEKFVPASSNAYACGMERCDPGPKSIFVAGGRVEWHGIPPNTPTWVNLVGVIAPKTPDESMPPMTLPFHCSTTGTLIRKDFSSSSIANTESTEISGNFWELQQRRSTINVAKIGLSGIKDCLVAHQSYVLSMKVRMIKDGYSGQPTNCPKTENNNNCIVALLDTMQDTLREEDLVSEVVYQGGPSASFRYNEWLQLDGTVSFTSQHLDEANVYLGLRILSGEADARLEFEIVSLQERQADACASSHDTVDCRDLVVCNGDAGYSATPPFQGTGGGQPVIKYDSQDTFNKHWHFEDGGMMWTIPKSCMVENAVYKLQMKLRSSTLTTATTQVLNHVTVAVYLKRGSIYLDKIDICSTNAHGEWMDCSGMIKIQADMLLKNDSDDDFIIHLQRVTGGSYDIDDLSIRFSHLASPVADLIVSRTVQETWLPGSEILVTSQSTAWNEQYVRTIAAVDPHDDDDDNAYVVLKLNATIPNPVVNDTVEEDFPMEVALLSRNIQVHGGHLTVYRTPSVTQTIHGVQFRGFESLHHHRQKYHQDQAPIRLYQSLNVEGSEIHGNVVMDSSNGGVIVDTTNHLSLNGNVAFHTSGHAFALKTGKEHAIRMIGNLGARTTTDTAERSSSHDSIVATTFLIVNATTDNVIQGNVAAGCQGYGFRIGSSSQSSLSFLRFESNNRAHSNEMGGITMALPSSSTSSSSSSSSILVQDLHVYRNLGPGLSIDLSNSSTSTSSSTTSTSSITIASSLFGDNRGGLVISGQAPRSTTIVLRDVTLIGQTDSLQLFDTADSSFCPGGNKKSSYAGIQVPPSSHVEFQNVTTVGFHPMDGGEMGGGHCVEHVLKISSISGN